ncbi:hypothetical protein QTP88_015809 [Uroleucon formosanum]
MVLWNILQIEQRFSLLRTHYKYVEGCHVGSVPKLCGILGQNDAPNGQRRLPSTIQPDRFYWTFCHDRVERDDYSGNGRVHGKVTGRPSRFPRFIGFILSHVFAGVGGVLGSMAHDIGDPDRVPSMPSA